MRLPAKFQLCSHRYMILNFAQAALVAVSLFSVHQTIPKNPDVAPVKAGQSLPKKAPLVFESGDSCFTFGWYYRPEFFYGKNLYLLCDCNPTDRVVQPGKHTFDTTIAYQYGNASHGFPIFEFKSVLRSRFTWGVAESPAVTGTTPIKFLDTVIADHAHSISLGLPIIRELWMDMSLNELFHFDSSTKHRLRLGFFPFSLGRGIALGEAYATTPDLLGYQISNAIQQFAPGFKFSGEIVPCNKLLYDLYVEIVDNRSDSFNNTNLNIRGQQYGRRFNQARGFGIMNYIVAGRLRGYPFNEPGKMAVIEPYFLFNDEREQKIEVLGDAASKLGTFGIAIEAEGGNFEFGLDTAMNVGHQSVYGLDRNIIQLEARKGVVTEVNSQVIAIADNPATGDIAGKKAVYTPDNQKFIDTSAQSAGQNGQDISGNLRNSKVRFRDPYCNKYHGIMIVADAAYTIARPQIKVAIAGGYASGDENPNKDLEDPNDSNVDGDFSGFIGLQEIYTGKRVRSGFLLSGAGRIPRVLSFPTNDLNDQFVSTVSRFTNIIYTGGALWMKLNSPHRTWDINTNLLLYWQDNRTRSFDRAAGQTSGIKYASRFLGIEQNIFLEALMFQDTKFFVTAGVFIPGTHYEDIKGRPLNREQQKFLDSLDQSGINVNRVPILGADTAWFINTGLTTRF